MVFSSVIFLFLFLPLVLTVYYMVYFLPRFLGLHRTASTLSNLFLFGASLLFYAWGEQQLAILLIISTVVDYAAALVIAGGLWTKEVPMLPKEGKRTTQQRLVLFISLLFNLGILGYFKYANFGIESFNQLVTALGAENLAFQNAMQIALPIGISFYTFQTMSYTIDVYRGEVRATRSLIDFGCFVTLFPQLVAGPIVRYADIDKELFDRKITLDRMAHGSMRFIVGLAKKVIFANTMAVPADAIFALPESSLTAPLAWLGIISYTLQIYYDFSGYSDMAIGLGQMMGFTFPENFNFPYISRSLTEFWRRWHMSLSTWFRDYLYLSLGGNRISGVRTLVNLLVVFLVSGLWHGAAWTFVVWGAFHGFFLLLERVGLARALNRLSTPVRYLYAMLVVMVGWVIFRADSLHHAWSYLLAMGLQGDAVTTTHPLPIFLTNEYCLVGILAILFAHPIVPTYWEKLLNMTAEVSPMLRELLTLGVSFLRAPFACAVVVHCASLLASGTHNPFLYFRF